MQIRKRGAKWLLFIALCFLANTAGATEIMPIYTYYEAPPFAVDKTHSLTIAAGENWQKTRTGFEQSVSLHSG